MSAIKQISTQPYMSHTEFNDLLSHINLHHSQKNCEAGKKVSYINPVFDVNLGCVLTVYLRGQGWHATLNCDDKLNDPSESLFQRCMNFLDS